MDIKIYGEDLDKFVKCMESNLPEHLHIVSPKVFSPYFYDFVYRIYDDRYLIREENETDKAYGNYQNRVGTDVFLLQKMPNSAFLQKLTIFRIKMVYGLAMGHRVLLDKYDKYTLLQKIQVSILSGIGKLISLDKIHGMYIRILKKWEKSDVKYRMCSNYQLRNLRTSLASNYSSVAYGEIRGRKFPVPNGFDAELTELYGDYMKPPKDRSVYIQHLDEKDTAGK